MLTSPGDPMGGSRRGRSNCTPAHWVVNIMYLMRHEVRRPTGRLLLPTLSPNNNPETLEGRNSLSIWPEERHRPQFTEECFHETGDGEKQCGEIHEDLRDYDENQSHEGQSPYRAVDHHEGDEGDALGEKQEEGLARVKSHERALARFPQGQETEKEEIADGCVPALVVGGCGAIEIRGGRS